MSLIVWNLQKEIKNQVLCRLFQISNVHQWDWLCYSTFCLKYNESKRPKNDEQNPTTMFLKYYYFELVGKGWLKTHNHNFFSFMKLLCWHFCYFIHGQSVINKNFFQKLSVIGEISIELSQKKNQIIENEEAMRKGCLNLCHGFMGLQQCTEGEREFWTHFWKFP